MKQTIIKRGGIFLFLFFGSLFAFIAVSKAQASALKIEAEWQDRATIIIKNIQFENNNELPDDVSAQLSYQDVNELLKPFPKTLLDTDINDGRRTYISTSVCGEGTEGGNRISMNEEEYFSGENITLTDLYINGDRIGCKQVIRQDYKLKSSNANIRITKQENRFIFFNWEDNNTLVRVDGGPTFKKSDEANRNNKAVYSEEGDQGSNGCVRRVELEESPKAPYTRAKYYLCSEGGGGLYLFKNDPGSVRITGFDAYRNNPDSVQGGTGTDAPPTCESQNDTIIIGWLLCQVMAAVDSTVSSLMRTIDDLLYVNPDIYINNDNLRAVWSYFRVIATFLLVAIGLIMVISQAIGGNR